MGPPAQLDEHGNPKPNEFVKDPNVKLPILPSLEGESQETTNEEVR